MLVEMCNALEKGQSTVWALSRPVICNFLTNTLFIGLNFSRWLLDDSVGKYTFCFFFTLERVTHQAKH